jgi:hypothetical protein
MTLHSYVINADIAPFYFARHYLYMFQPLVCHELILQQPCKNNNKNKDDGHNEVKTMMKFNCKSYGK